MQDCNNCQKVCTISSLLCANNKCNIGNVAESFHSFMHFANIIDCQKVCFYIWYRFRSFQYHVKWWWCHSCVQLPILSKHRHLLVSYKENYIILTWVDKAECRKIHFIYILHIKRTDISNIKSGILSLRMLLEIQTKFLLCKFTVRNRNGFKNKWHLLSLVFAM